MAAEPAKSGFRAPAEESALAAGEDQAERAARRRLAAEFAVSRVLLESTSVDEAAVRLLPAIGQGLEWEMGGLWTVDPAQNVLRCNQFWTAPELTCPVDAFVAASRSVVFARGSGLPGRVWQRGEPAWITDVTEDTHFLRRAAAREDGVRGAFAFPIRGVRQTLGVIEFFRTEIQLVDEELLQMAATLGGQIGQFLERLQAEQEIQRRAREFEALYETTRDLAGSRQDLRTLLETLVERARTLLKAAAGHVWLYDAARADLEVGVAQHFPVPLGTRIRLGEGMAGRVALTREPLTVEDYRSWEHCPPRFAGMPITAVLQVPMLYGGELVGVLGVNERDGVTGRRFGEADIRLLSLFAAHAAGAIVSTKAQQALGESEARLRRLVEQFPAVLWSTDTELRFTASLGAGLRALGLEPGEVVGRSLYDYFGMGPDDPLMVLQRRALAGEAVTYETEWGGRTFLSYAEPLRSADGAIAGTIGVAFDITERKRLEAELATLYQREHQVAESLQRSLLLAPRENAFDGISVTTHYDAASDDLLIGGDFFDVFALDAGKVALVLGDVSGKGLAAAVQTAEVKYALRAFLREQIAPAAALARLNDFVCETHRLEVRETGWIVLSLAVIDPATGAAALSVAGAEPPLLVGADGGTTAVEGGGMPLGVEPGESYPTIPARLAPGDALVLVTDGITEARRDGTLLGYEGMTRIARRALREHASLRDAGRSLLNETRAFAGGTLQDDACIVIARRQ